MQENAFPVDPEEQAEKKLINYMALAIVALVVGGALILALRPWIQQLRDQSAQPAFEATSTPSS